MMRNTTDALENQLLAKGRRGQLSVLGQPDILDLHCAARESGIPPTVLREMCAAGQLLSLTIPGTDENPHFPAWQFEQPVLDAMPTILQAFGSDRTWQAYDFLTRPEPLLAGEVPLNVLRAGGRDAVLGIASAAARMDEGGY